MVNKKVGGVYVDAGLKDKQFKEQAGKFSKSVEKLGGNISNSFKKQIGAIGGMVAGVFSVKAIIDFGKMAVKTSAQFEDFRTQFEVMTGSIKEAEIIIKRLEKNAASTPFSMESLTEGTKKLMAFGIGSESAIDSLMRLGDIAGGNEQKLGTLTLAFGKMSAKGKADLESLNMMIEAGVPILDVLADRYGVAKDELFKMITAGKVSFEEINNSVVSMTSQGGRYFGMMAKQAETLNGLSSTLKDNFKLLGKDMFENSIPYIKSTQKFLIGFIDSIRSNNIGSIFDTFSKSNSLNETVKRYDELAKKTKLNTDEQKELEKIQKALIDQYPKLDKAIDVNTGKIDINSKAWKHMQATIFTDNQNNIAVLEESFSKLIKKYEDVTNTVYKNNKADLSTYSLSKKKIDLEIKYADLEKERIERQKQTGIWAKVNAKGDNEHFQLQQKYIKDNIDDINKQIKKNNELKNKTYEYLDSIASVYSELKNQANGQIILDRLASKQTQARIEDYISLMKKANVTEKEKEDTNNNILDSIGKINDKYNELIKSLNDSLNPLSEADSIINDFKDTLSGLKDEKLITQEQYNEADALITKLQKKMKEDRETEEKDALSLKQYGQGLEKSAKIKEERQKQAEITKGYLEDLKNGIIQAVAEGVAGYYSSEIEKQNDELEALNEELEIAKANNDTEKQDLLEQKISEQIESIEKLNQSQEDASEGVEIASES